MIRAQDVRGASGDDPVVWELVAERLHASRIESRYIEIRASQAAQLGDAFETHKARVVADVTAWERGEEMPGQTVAGVNHVGSSDAEVSGADRSAGGDAAGASESVAAPPDASRGRRAKSVSGDTAGVITGSEA